jgi:nicotinamide riboside transporter PnuC
MTWFVAAASLFATWLNIRKVRLCFAIWFVTNVTWAAIDFVHGLPAQALLMLTYAGLAVWGWLSWGRTSR